MAVHSPLSSLLLDGAMHSYFRCKFPELPGDELDTRIEETLRFLFISHECTGPIPVSREVDEVWHAWILQTQEYFGLCEQLPTGRYIHHSSNDYLRYFDPNVGEEDDMALSVKMLALYVTNFGHFTAASARHWLLVRHLMDRWGWSLSAVNDWLEFEAPGCAAVTSIPAKRASLPIPSESMPLGALT